jgi:hypothetical protein
MSDGALLSWRKVLHSWMWPAEQCSVESVDGGAESQAGRKLLAACLGLVVECLVHAGQRGQAVKHCFFPLD